MEAESEADGEWRIPEGIVVIGVIVRPRIGGIGLNGDDASAIDGHRHLGWAWRATRRRRRRARRRNASALRLSAARRRRAGWRNGGARRRRALRRSGARRGRRRARRHGVAKGNPRRARDIGVGGDRRRVVSAAREQSRAQGGGTGPGSLANHRGALCARARDDVPRARLYGMAGAFPTRRTEICSAWVRHAHQRTLLAVRTAAELPVAPGGQAGDHLILEEASPSRDGLSRAAARGLFWTGRRRA